MSLCFTFLLTSGTSALFTVLSKSKVQKLQNRSAAQLLNPLASEGVSTSWLHGQLSVSVCGVDDGVCVLSGVKSAVGL